MSEEALFPKAWRRRVLVAASLIGLASLGWLVTLTVGLERADDARLFAAREKAAAQARHITAALASRLESIVPLVDQLVADLESGVLLRDAVPARLERDFTRTEGSGILEIGVAYATVDSQDAPHYGIKEGKARHFKIEESYDYGEQDWYRQTLIERAHWSEPYFGEATKSWAAGYARAFDDPGGETGVARVNFGLTDVHRLLAVDSAVQLREVGDTAYALLLSQQRRIIAHPVAALVGKTTAELEAKQPILAAISGLQQGGHDRYLDNTTGETYWIFAEELAAAEWTAAVVFNQREVLAHDGGVSHREPLILAAVILALSLGMIVLGAHRGTERAIWRLALFTAAVFAAATVAIWVLHLSGSLRLAGEDLWVVDETAVEALLETHGVNPSANRVPTGVFVQSLRFTSANNVLLTGYVWQRPPGSTPPPGVILPEAEEVTVTPVRDGLWYFETTLRQQFDYSRYPFDREKVWIRMWPGDLGHFTGGVVLVPDFAGYPARRPAETPGLEAGMVLGGWDLTDSHFSYRANQYNADFGLGPRFRAEESLELYFDIGLKRDFLSPFIADFIPIIVVAILVFKVLMSSTRRESAIGLSGFSVSAVLGYCAALFFVLIVSHIHLREALQSSGIIYIEWFYFAMYLAILAVSTNAMVFASDANAPLIHYRDNMLVKQAYWPVLTALLFAVTLAVF